MSNLAGLYLVLVATLLFVSCMLSACEESGSQPDVFEDHHENDADEDDGPDDLQIDVETEDIDSVGLDSEDAFVEDQRSPPLKGRDEACETPPECERGLFCFSGRCQRLVGCAISPFEGAGCIIEDASGGVATAPECETDTDCEPSPHGPWCVEKTCGSRPRCQSDVDCSQDSEFCYQQKVCLDTM